MKITSLPPHLGLSSGVKIFLKYANLLSRRGHEVTVVSIDRLFVGKNVLRWKPKSTELDAKLRYVSSFNHNWIPDGDVIDATTWTAKHTVQ